jgi:glycosyltransferase involved in cell wall biosynthesis
VNQSEAPPPGAPSVLHIGGDHTLGVIAIDQLRGLRELGWDIHVACHPEGWEDRLLRHGFSVHPIRLPYRASPLEAARGARDLLALLRGGRFGLVHTHNAHHGLVGRCIALALGIPAVHTWRYSPLDAAGSRPARLVFGVLEAAASHAGQMVLFQNGEDREFAVRIRIVPERRAVLVGNGIRLERFDGRRTDGAATRRELGIPAGARLITCVARLVERKRQADLLTAAAALRPRIPDVAVVLVGEGPDEPNLRRQASELGIEDRVLFAGQRDDVPDLLRASDALCLPSRREGLPRAVMEAMAAGIPVVATDVVGTREMVRHEETGLLVPFANPLALATALERLLTDRRLLERLTEAARKTLEANWRQAAVDRRVARVYRALLS